MNDGLRNGNRVENENRAPSDFRNEYVAHRELNYKKPVPYFDPALEVAYVYDGWIRDIISPDVFEEPPLNEFAGEGR